MNEKGSIAMSQDEMGDLKYEFFTPYHRGGDLVFDFLCAQTAGRFERAPWSVTASYGYERSRDTKVYAEDQYVGSAHAISERFALLAPAYQGFMRTVETAATEWQAAKQAREAAELSQSREADMALCERVLAASEPPTNRSKP